MEGGHTSDHAGPLFGIGADLKCDAFNDIDRINDIAQRLGHLAAMSISHHRVQVHLLEWHLACRAWATVNLYVPLMCHIPGIAVLNQVYNMHNQLFPCNSTDSQENTAMSHH